MCGDRGYSHGPLAIVSVEELEMVRLGILARGRVVNALASGALDEDDLMPLAETGLARFLPRDAPGPSGSDDGSRDDVAGTCKLAVLAIFGANEAILFFLVGVTAVEVEPDPEDEVLELVRFDDGIPDPRPAGYRLALGGSTPIVGAAGASEREGAGV